MRTLLAKYGYLLIWTGAIIGAGIVFWLIIQANAHLTPLAPAPPPPAANQGPPPPPPSPSVTFTVQKSSKGNKLFVQWANLPANTTGLNIFRSPKNKDQWSLWKHIAITPGELAGGSLSINIGSSLYSNYSFYIEATGGGGGGGGNASSTLILWTSSSTIVTVTTSTSTSTLAASTTTTSQNSTSPTSSSTSATGTTSSATSGTTSGGGTTPTGTPYYTPQLQISSYGSSPGGTFWVQHVDQKIQMGWQNLPSSTTNISVFRSPNQGGPWTTILSQTNPGVNGYSFQIVDETVGQPNYYEMQVFAGSSVIATYGPVYLPAVGQ